LETFAGAVAPKKKRVGSRSIGLAFILLTACLSRSPARGQEPAPAGSEQVLDAPPNDAAPKSSPVPPPDESAKPPATVSTAIKSVPNYGKQAWGLLREGAKETKTDRRAAAVRALSVLRGESRAVRLSSGALADDKLKVRAAACEALGELGAVSATPKLRLALDDKDISVVLAAAQALHKLKDPAGDEAYYSILTGDRKGTKGLVAGQLDTLKDPKKMALLGFEEGIGFVPFAGIGYSAFKAIHTDDSSKVRAVAARMVAHDPDVLTQNALVQAAVTDKSALVRAAALASLSERGNPAVIAGIADAMADGNDTVKYTAAGVILHLKDLAARKAKAPK
jgi:HEAT repeats